MDVSIICTAASWAPCERAHNLRPDACASPANETVVAGRVRPKLSGRSRHGAPDRKTQKIPLRTRRSFTRGTPRGLFGSIGLITGPLIVGQRVAHDSSPRFGELESRFGESVSTRLLLSVMSHVAF